MDESGEVVGNRLLSMADVLRVFDELDLDSVESVEVLEATVVYLSQMLRLLWVEGRLEADDLEGLLMKAEELGMRN